MQVSEIFYSVQGEGPNIGTPAVFIRFAGCNLSCPWCISYIPGRVKPVIWTAKQNKKIWDIKVGDKILALNDQGLVDETTVQEIYTRDVEEILEIKIQGKPLLYVTPEHPFLIHDKWIKAEDLKIGDEISFISPKEKLSAHAKFYNSWNIPEVRKGLIIKN
jgi:hypothetical protein